MGECLIYVVRNTLNGKVYVGQTRQGLKQRQAEHLSRLARGERDHKLYRAMRKHGGENFEFAVVCHALRPEHLDDLEVSVIAQFNSFHRGYNMTPGGNSTTDEALAKISKALKGRVITWHAKMWESRRRNGNASTRQFIPAGENNVKAKSYLIETPTGRLIAITGLKAFCTEMGLTAKGLYDTMNGVQRHHKGYVMHSPLGVGLNEDVAKYHYNTLLVGA